MTQAACTRLLRFARPLINSARAAAGTPVKVAQAGLVWRLARTDRFAPEVGLTERVSTATTGNTDGSCFWFLVFV